MKNKVDAPGKADGELQEKRYVRRRTVLGVALMVAVAALSAAIIANLRLSLSRDQLFQTNRTRIQTVLSGLEAGVTEKAGLYSEYDQLYAAKLKNTEYYYDGFAGQTFNSAFAKAVADYADIPSVAIIGTDGSVYGAWNCRYDFTLRRFAMLRDCGGEDGMSIPFSIDYADGTKRFFGKLIAPDRILVFVQEWTQTQSNIANMTSWEAVLRGMISVDTVSIAVSLKDYTFLYNPIGDLTGKDALQNGMPISSLSGGPYEGELTLGGEEWCVVGRPWNDAMVFVMTRSNTDLANDTILIFFISLLVVVFIGLVSIYGVIINRDDLRIGKMPSFVTLLRARTAQGEERHLLNFNLTVAGKLLPIALAGILVVSGMGFYLQSLNGLASIAFESNRAIEEIGNKLEANVRDAEEVNTEYKEMFLNKCLQIARLLEQNPRYIFDYDTESERVHAQPALPEGKGPAAEGLDIYGNQAYAVSEQPFLQELCELNAIERIAVFDEYGRIMATSDDAWYFVIDGDEADAQTYPFWEILAEHCDFYTQDLSYDEEGAYSQYIGNACYYYTVQQEDGSTAYVSRADYEDQLAGSWQGPAIQKHRGMVQIGIAPERLRTVAETATMNYVAAHTTVHGTGHVVICDNSPEHLCLYSPRAADIGKAAVNMGYSAGAFNESGEMYNGYETVNGVQYFQTFKMVDTYDCYIGTAVPLSTVFATRDKLTLATLFVALAGLLLIFLYTCSFGEKEERLYRENVQEAEWRLRNEQDMITLTMPSGKTRRVRSAASRWDPEYIPWWNKTPEQKFSQVLRVVFYVFADLLFACILLSRSGIFPIDAIDYVYEGVWNKGFNIFAMTNCAITLIVVFVVANVAQTMIDNICVNIGSRAETLGHLFSSVLRYGAALFAVFYALYLCGLDTGSLIASAGIMSLVIGLGAQSMIQDILAGVFIVFEGAFRVGDIVTIGDFRGNVLEIGLRTTKIADASKNIKVFNNSTLSGIINMTKEASYAAIDVGIAYDESIEKVEDILKKELPKFAKRLPAIMDGPYYKGVSELAASSVNIKIIALCKEQDRIQLCRDLNREMLILFQKYDITIPFPQVTVSQLEDPAPPTEEERLEARRFAAQQKAKEEKGDALTVP